MGKAGVMNRQGRGRGSDTEPALCWRADRALDEGQDGRKPGDQKKKKVKRRAD